MKFHTSILLLCFLGFFERSVTALECSNKTLQFCLDYLSKDGLDIDHIDDDLPTWNGTVITLQDRCRTFDKFTECMNGVTENCQARKYAGWIDAYEYLCKKSNLTLVVDYLECYTSPAVVDSVESLCKRVFDFKTKDLLNGSKTVSMNKMKDYCKLADNFFACLNKTLTTNCGEEAAKWQWNWDRTLSMPILKTCPGWISTRDDSDSDGGTSDKLPYKSDPVLVQTIKTKAAEERKKPITGLTILDKELFVVSDESSDVEVYDTIKFSFNRRWTLKELISPWDIGSCNRNKCLYIIDYRDQSNTILRVDPNGELIKKWSTGDEYGFSVSVTDDSNVILAVYKKNILNEYSPDGQLLREVIRSPDAGIGHPRHAIRLSNDYFMVSHGLMRDDLHRVCVVDADGKLIKSFGGKCGSSIGQMDEPVHLSVDRNGFVMVADHLNSRVLLLDPDLKFKRVILSKEEKYGLRYPFRILLDQSNGRVFVADNGLDSEKKIFTDGRILIFDFK